MKSSRTLKKIDDASCSFPNKVRNDLFGLCRVWIKYKRWESERMIRIRTHGSYTHIPRERGRCDDYEKFVAWQPTNPPITQVERQNVPTCARVGIDLGDLTRLVSELYIDRKSMTLTLSSFLLARSFIVLVYHDKQTSNTVDI